MKDFTWKTFPARSGIGLCQRGDLGPLGVPAGECQTGMTM